MWSKNGFLDWHDICFDIDERLAEGRTVPRILHSRMDDGQHKGYLTVDVFESASIPARRSLTSSFSADLAVLGVAFVWGASYPVAKSALFYAPVLILILYRFLITTIFMAVVARHEIASISWGDCIRGLVLGTILFRFLLLKLTVLHQQAP